MNWLILSGTLGWISNARARSVKLLTLRAGAGGRGSVNSKVSGSREKASRNAPRMTPSILGARPIRPLRALADSRPLT